MLNNFKQVYSEYSKNKTLESENFLLKSIVYDYRFYMCYTQEENQMIVLRLITDNNGDLILNLYSEYEEVEEDVKNEYWAGHIDFEAIIEYVNSYNADAICINPLTDNFKLTCSQLMDLYRQSVFGDMSSPMKLDKDNDFTKTAYKIKDIEPQKISNKVIDIYNDYLNENDKNIKKELLQQFYNELLYNARFFSIVVPKEEALENQSNPLITRDRVMYFKTDEIKGEYCLFTDVAKLEEYFELDINKDYVAIFNFDECISMMDGAHGVINGLNIVSDLDLTIPSKDIYKLKVQKDRNDELDGAIILTEEYIETEEINNIEKKLFEYFSNMDSINKIWLQKEQYLYKDKSTNIIYNVFIECKKDVETENEFSINNEELREIFNNKCFKVSILEEELENETSKLIYEG